MGSVPMFPERGQKAAEHMRFLIRQGLVVGNPETKGRATTIGNKTVLSTHPDYNVGDMAVEILGEWQRRGSGQHGYSPGGWDEEQMDRELDKFVEYLKEHKAKPSDTLRHKER